MQKLYNAMRAVIVLTIVLLAFAYALLLFIALGSGERWDNYSTKNMHVEAHTNLNEELQAQDAHRTPVLVTKKPRQAATIDTWPPPEAANYEDGDASGSMNLLPSS